MADKEELSQDEIATLKALQAKAKRIQRAKKADEQFFRKADEHKDELLARWSIPMSGHDHPAWMTGTNNDDDIY